jgi:hypothetical protein
MAVHRVVFYMAQFGQICNNVMHFVSSVPWSPTDANGLATHLRDNWIALVRPRITVNVNWFTIEVRNAENPTQQAHTLPTSILGVQASNATLQPAITSLIMRFRTFVAGPSGRGRIYMPGPPLADFNNGIMIPTAIAGWNGILGNLAGLYIGDAPVSGYKLVVAPRAQPGQWKQVTGLEISNLLHSQRRRNIGIGT